MILKPLQQFDVDWNYEASLKSTLAISLLFVGLSLAATGAVFWYRTVKNWIFEKVHQLVNLRLCNMADIDYALRLLQNKVRRQILERLVREPHYPMQLAELIGVSQQAIKKHLKELEQGDFVTKLQVL